MNILRPIRKSATAVFSGRRSTWGWAGLLCMLVIQGCAAFHPISGVPAAYVPDEFLGPSRSGKKTIDLSLLVQRQPDQYRLAAGDILSVYVPGVLGSLHLSDQGDIGETPPINLPQGTNDPPTIGYPTTIRGDGTVSLPLVQPINLNGLTLAEAEQTVREAYTVHTDILNDKRHRVLLSLARRREYNVLVVRQETSSTLSSSTQPGSLNIGSSKRGTAKLVRLPAYENDVLHALAKAEGGADGLPGLDAENTVYVVRRKRIGPEAYPPPTPAMPAFAPPIEPPPMHRPDPQPAPASPALPVGPPPVAPEQILHSLPSSVTIRQNEMFHSRMQSESVSAPAIQSGPNSSSSVRHPEPPSSWETQSRPPLIIPQSPSQQGLPLHPVQQLEQRAPETPHWPQPAAPPESLRRTSETGAAVWGHTSKPVFRGQSPAPVGGQLMGPTMSAVTIPEWPAMDWGGHDRSWPGQLMDFDPTVDSPHIVKIPIRLSQGDRPTFSEQDIILQDGDIVFIESRETEVFYTGGLLGGGQYTLPRDYDLGVLEAISIAQSPHAQRNQTTRAIGGVSAMNMDVTFSASHVVILRQLPNGTRMPIEVDLYKALRRPETENILIQPGDIVMLQYSKLEAVGAFIERHLLEGALFGVAAAQLNNNRN